MLAQKSTSHPTRPFPWEEAHACHEDRAMGFELELIELVHQRELAEAEGAPVTALDRQIDAVMAELAAEVASLAK